MGQVRINTVGNGDNVITSDEWNTWKTNNTSALTGQIQITDSSGRVLATYNDVAALEAALNGGSITISNSGGNLPPDAAGASQLDGQMAALLAEYETANAARKAEIREELAGLVAQAKQMKTQNSGLNFPHLAQAEQKADSGGNGSGFKASATMTSGGNGGGTTGTTGGYAAQTMGGGAGGAAVPFPPGGWGAQVFNGGQFNSSAYAQSMAVEDNVLSSWDEVNKNTNRGKQLMMLFFYFAKMAESGDMGAMYQFMKFITYIISKDKAKQQIEMGKKLIQLQDLSRQWTNKLLNLQTSASDPNTSNELMKTMTIVKSETDAIATSQKLISQMMEEFAQVVETLTNTTKSALETAGRIQRTVSRFSA